MKKCLMHSAYVAGLVGFSLAANAQVTEPYSFITGTPIKIDTTFGTIDSHSISSSITSITSIEVFLNITSTAYNSDLKVVLSHGADSAVLLNRVGRDTSSLDLGLSNFGYNDNGFNITFSDSATYNDGSGDKAKDVHIYRAILYGDNSVSIPNPGVLTGTFAPDGRATDGSVATTSDPRTALLSSFTGADASGFWNLQLKDFVSQTDDQYLVSWGMNITGVPEPQTYALVFGLGLMGAAMLRKTLAGRNV